MLGATGAAASSMQHSVSANKVLTSARAALTGLTSPPTAKYTAAEARPAASAAGDFRGFLANSCLPTEGHNTRSRIITKG